MKRHTIAVVLAAIVAVIVAIFFATSARAAPVVPTDIQQPGTQTDVASP